MEIEPNDYEKIKKLLDEMPNTFRGGILAHMIKLCKKRFFKDENSLTAFINNVYKNP